MDVVDKIKKLYRDKGFTSTFVHIRFWDAPLVEVSGASMIGNRNERYSK